MGLNLLLVDDDPVFSDALRAELLGFAHRVSFAADGRAALQAVDREQFDAMLLDWMMPGMDGIAVLRRLREEAMTLPVIMLSARGSVADRVEGLESGADDYLVKPVAGVEVDARLRALLRGRGWAAPGADTIRVGDIVVSPGKFRAWRNGRAIELGKLELRLLAELARNAGAVLTRPALLERVWGYEVEPATNIVEAYVRRLRIKLTAAGESDPIRTVRGVGYVLRD